MDPYEELANTIILRAVKDYRRALKKLKSKPLDEDAEKTRKECLRFFRSDWFSKLTDIEPEFLIRKLNEEVKA